MKKTMLFIVFFVVTISTASAVPLNLKGVDGPIYQEGAYLIDSSNMPCLFYDDAGSTTKFEALTITPSRTIFSNKFIKYSDDFETDKWSIDSYSSSNISRSVNGVVSEESVIYPTIDDEQASVKYNIGFINKIETATITVIGTRRDTEHNLEVWIGSNDTDYSKIIEFENPERTTKQADITSYLQDNQTWIEFRFLKSSFGDNSPRILDFSIEAMYEEDIASPAANNSVKEWHPIDVTIGDYIEIPTRTIDKNHFYYFAPHHSSPMGPSKARVAYLGSKYPVIDLNNQRAVLGKFIKNDADIVLTYGTPISLGSGFVLEIEDVSKDENVVIALKKDGIVLDRGIFEEGKTHSYKTEVAAVEDTELFKADMVSVFRSDFYTKVELNHVYLLDTVATIIEDGESFGYFEVDLDDFDGDGDVDITIRLKNDRTFTLDRNSTIDLFGGLSIKVADSDDLLFTVIKEFTKSGEYQQTGTYGSYGQTYSINSFDAPGLFTYDMDKNDTLESLSISSSKQNINEIIYSSLNKNKRMTYLGKTYHVGFSGEDMLLNEILKDEDEKFILRYGSPVRLENFIVELQDIGEETVLLQLKKDGDVLEESVVEKGGSFVYKKSIEKKDVEIFNATVKNVFRSEFTTFVEIENIRILDENAIVLKNGDTFRNDYEISITDINGDSVADVEVILKSGESFTVDKDSTTEILGGYLSLKAYENTFLPVRNVKIDIEPDVSVPLTSMEISDVSSAQNSTPAQIPDEEIDSMQLDSLDSKTNPKKESVFEYVLMASLIFFVIAHGWFKSKD